jgi:hypothetical protein
MAFETRLNVEKYIRTGRFQMTVQFTILAVIGCPDAEARGYGGIVAAGKQ